MHGQFCARARLTCSDIVSTMTHLHVSVSRSAVTALPAAAQPAAAARSRSQCRSAPRVIERSYDAEIMRKLQIHDGDAPCSPAGRSSRKGGGGGPPPPRAAAAAASAAGRYAAAARRSQGHPRDRSAALASAAVAHQLHELRAAQPHAVALGTVEPGSLAQGAAAAPDAGRGTVRLAAGVQLQRRGTWGPPAMQARLQPPGAGAAGSLFAELLAVCELTARSQSAVDWKQTVVLLQRLVHRVSSPLQAQQVWQVALMLAARPLYKAWACALSDAVVTLVEVSLAAHDHSVLRALLAHGGRRFSLSRADVSRLVIAAAFADVGLDELAALLDAAPPRSLSARAFFVLTKAFMARGQRTEAAHCLRQMDAAGLRRSRSLEEIAEQLRIAAPRA